MARKLFKRFLPAPEKMREHRSLQLFGKLLHDPNLWHINRRSASVAFFIGLFTAFIPVPSQMLVAALLAIMCRANLPISVMLVWITNPFTMPAIFYLTYKVGAVLLGVQPEPIKFELSLLWIQEELSRLWKPLLLGSTLTGLFLGLLGASSVHILWRIHVIRRWRHRRARREAQHPGSTSRAAAPPLGGGKKPAKRDKA